MAPIYLDYNASTPIDPAAAMRPFLAKRPPPYATL